VSKAAEREDLRDKEVQTVPSQIVALVDRVCEPAPDDRSGMNRMVGVSDEMRLDIEKLSDANLKALVDAHGFYHKHWSLSDRRWGAEELLANVGSEVLPHLDNALEETEDPILQRYLISILGRHGSSALSVLDKAFWRLKNYRVAEDAVDVLFEIGEDAAYLIALALEHSDSRISSRVMMRINPSPNGFTPAPVEMASPIAWAVIDQLVGRDTSRPEHSNEVVTAQCLDACIARNPQLRRPIRAKLCDLAFEGTAAVRARAQHLASQLDLEDFLQCVRVKAADMPETAGEIMYRLGRAEQLPTQRESLRKFAGQLEALNERSLERWDSMAWQSKISYWLRFALTISYSLAGLALILLGVNLLLTSDDVASQGIGGAMSVLTMLGGILARFWRAPLEGLQESSTRQAGLEATFIGFMTRTGQIRLQFEQEYAQGEIGADSMKAYQDMIAKAQAQTARELALIGTGESARETAAAISVRNDGVVRSG
jgi:hypothetical protein